MSFWKKPPGWMATVLESDVDVLVKTNNLPEITQVSLYVKHPEDSPRWSDLNLVIETNLGTLILNPELFSVFHNCLCELDEDEFGLFEYNDKILRIIFEGAINFLPESVEVIRLEGVGLYFSVKNEEKEISFVFRQKMANVFTRLVLNELDKLVLQIGSEWIDVETTQLKQAIKRLTLQLQLQQAIKLIDDELKLVDDELKLIEKYD